MLKSVVQPQRFFKMWASAVAVGLIAVMAVSSPVNAETFTLDELTRGPGFTIGEVRFTRWEVREASGDPSKITVDTIDDPNLPGFQLNGNGQLADGDAELKYTFDVETTSEQHLILGGQLNLTSHTADEDGEISILLQEEDPEPDSLELEVFVNKDRDGDACASTRRSRSRLCEGNWPSVWRQSRAVEGRSR